MVKKHTKNLNSLFKKLKLNKGKNSNRKLSFGTKKPGNILKKLKLGSNLLPKMVAKIPGKKK